MARPAPGAFHRRREVCLLRRVVSDGKRIAFVDDRSRIRVLELAGGTLTTADTDGNLLARNLIGITWSPDSKWLAYSKAFPNRFRRIVVWSVADGKPRRSPMRWPMRSARLGPERPPSLFLASTDLGLASGWANISSIGRQATRGPTSPCSAPRIPPFPPQSDEEGQAAAAPSRPPAPTTPSAAPAPAAPRRRALPACSAHNPRRHRLDADRPGADRQPDPRPPGAGPGLRGAGHRSDRRGPLAERIPLSRAPRCTSTSCPSGGPRASSPGWDSSPSPATGRSCSISRGQLDRHRHRGAAPPRRRPAHGGSRPSSIPRSSGSRSSTKPGGWNGISSTIPGCTAPTGMPYARYAPLVPYVRHRADLTYILDQVGGELSVGHSFVGGGDFGGGFHPHRAPGRRPGARRRALEDRPDLHWESWNPELRAPLDAPGLRVRPASTSWK